MFQRSSQVQILQFVLCISYLKALLVKYKSTDTLYGIIIDKTTEK